MNGKKVIGVLPARYASSRFPGKPLAMILGKPMIAWVYEQAMKASGMDEVYVATDDERIKAVCDEYKMNCLMTSEDCSTGAERVAEVAQMTDGDIYLNIQGDEPLIDPKEIERIIQLKLDNTDVGYIGYRSSIEDEADVMNPNVVKCITDLDGNAMYYSRSPIPYTKDLSCVYRCMGLYAYDRDTVLNFKKWGQSKLEKAEKGVEMLRLMEHGIKVRMFETNWHSIGVDLPEQIKEVEEIMKRNNDGK